ncbi:hypothetical protein U1Q18_052045, partial [Sarracenia purpurea var. burkii]
MRYDKLEEGARKAKCRKHDAHFDAAVFLRVIKFLINKPLLGDLDVVPLIVPVRGAHSRCSSRSLTNGSLKNVAGRNT